MKTLTLLLALVSLNLFGQALVTVGEDKSPPKAVIESGRAAQRSEPQPPLEYVKPQDTASTDTVAAEPAVTAADVAALNSKFDELKSLLSAHDSELLNVSKTIAVNAAKDALANPNLITNGALNMDVVKQSVVAATPAQYQDLVKAIIGLATVWLIPLIGRFWQAKINGATHTQALQAVVCGSGTISQPIVEAEKNVPATASDAPAALPVVEPPGQSAPPAPTTKQTT